jgi:hypothetical protein
VLGVVLTIVVVAIVVLAIVVLAVVVLAIVVLAVVALGSSEILRTAWANSVVCMNVLHEFDEFFDGAAGVHGSPR